MRFDNLPFGTVTVTIEIACNDWNEQVRVAEVFERMNDGTGSQSVLIAVQRALQKMMEEKFEIKPRSE